MVEFEHTNRSYLYAYSTEEISSSNSEANASELLEDIDEKVIRVTDSSVLIINKGLDGIYHESSFLMIQLVL